MIGGDSGNSASLGLPQAAAYDLPPVESFELRAPRPRRLLMPLVVGITAGVQLVRLQSAGGGDPTVEMLLLGLLLYGVVGVVQHVMGRRRQATELPPILLYMDRMLLPSQQSLHYSRITALQRRTQGPARGLLIEYEGNRMGIPEQVFESPAVVDRLYESLRQRIARTVGSERLARLDSSAALSRDVNHRKPLATYAILGLIVVGYAVEMATFALSDLLSIARIGANVGVLVFDGEWFRLVSSNFLHGGLLHILLNGLAIWSLGAMFERLAGSSRLLVVYLGSAVAGAAASAVWASAPVSLGASTAAFGLLGGLGALQLHFRSRLPAEYRQSSRWWLFILGINVGISLLPMVDGAAHLGGFVAGGALAYPLLLGLKKPGGDREKTPLWIRGAAVVVSLVCLVGLGQAAAYAVNPPADLNNRLLSLYVDDERANATSLNQLAWVASVDEASTPETLALAVKAAERANEEEPDNHMITDTLATAVFAAGDALRAVDLEREALDQGREPIYAAQVARMFAGLATGGAPVVLGDAPASLPTLTLAAEDNKAMLRVEGLGRPEGSPTLFALVERDGEPTILVRLLVGNRGGELAWELRALSGALEGNESVRLLAFDGRKERPERGAVRWVPTWDAWRADRLPQGLGAATNEAATNAAAANEAAADEAAADEAQ